jgi:Na+/citrate or Na+/malate symporter
LVQVSGKGVGRWLENHHLNHRNYVPLFGVPLMAMLINHLFGSVNTALVDDLLVDFIIGVIFGWLSLVGYELIRPIYQKWQVRRGKRD